MMAFQKWEGLKGQFNGVRIVAGLKMIFAFDFVYDKYQSCYDEDQVTVTLRVTGKFKSHFTIRIININQLHSMQKITVIYA